MTRRADVSVAIPTLNRPDRLTRCLDAIFAGETLPQEVVVVDQGDDEVARTVLEPYGTYGAVLIYVRQERRGLSASRNAAFMRATRPIVAVTDDDCVPGPGWIAAILAAFS